MASVAELLMVPLSGVSVAVPAPMFCTSMLHPAVHPDALAAGIDTAIADALLNVIRFPATALHVGALPPLALIVYVVPVCGLIV